MKLEVTSRISVFKKSESHRLCDGCMSIIEKTQMG